jgi:predicted dehydrogenase
MGERVMIRLAMIGCGNMGTAHRRAPQQLAGRAIWRLYEAEKNGIVADLRGLGMNSADWVV